MIAEMVSIPLISGLVIHSLGLGALPWVGGLNPFDFRAGYSRGKVVAMNPLITSQSL